MWPKNPARLKTSNSYYAKTDSFSLPTRIAIIRTSCMDRGIMFPPSKEDIRIHHEQSQLLSAESVGVLKAIFSRVLRFVLSIFNTRLSNLSSITFWARHQLGRRARASRVTKTDEEAVERRDINSAEAGTEAMFVRTEVKERHHGDPTSTPPHKSREPCSGEPLSQIQIC